jgi:hypothetical protein
VSWPSSANCHIEIPESNSVWKPVAIRLSIIVRNRDADADGALSAALSRARLPGR